MSGDLILKSACRICKSMTELYGSNCKHLTLCVSCGQSMAEKRTECYDCGAPITRLIREYNVRACSSTDKNYFIGKFVSGLPDFSKWCIDKEGRQLSDEKYKNKPWVLEDETGQFRYHGVLEGAPSATYYALMRQRKEFVAIPADSWYNFNKDARYKYKQFTLEEAEEKMNKRRKTANGYGRWMMKAPNNGAAALGEVDEKESGVGGGRGCKKATGNDHDEANGEEDEEEESARKNRLGPNRKGAAADDDAEGPRGGDFDFDDVDDIEKGDDWEHEEVFTDDDENDPEERGDFGPEIPAPPEFKQDEEDEEGEEKEGGLSNSGKELKKLLGRTNGLNESDAEDEDDEISASPILAPKQKDAPKEEPVDNSPLKLISLAPAHGASSSSKSAKGKRKVSSDDAKAATVVPSKKAKTENDVKPVKEEPVSTSKKNAPKKGPSSVPTESWSAVSGPVTEDEIRAVLTQEKPMTTQELVAKFTSRLTCKEDKEAFALKLKRISKLHKTTSGKSFVVLREMKPDA